MLLRQHYYYSSSSFHLTSKSYSFSDTHEQRNSLIIFSLCPFFTPRSNGTWLHLRAPRRMDDLHNYLSRRLDRRPSSFSANRQSSSPKKASTDVRSLWCSGGYGAVLTIGGNLVTWGHGAGGWLGHPFPYLKLRDTTGKSETGVNYVYDVDAMEEVEPGPPRQSKILRARTFESDYNLFVGKEVKVKKGLRKEGVRIADGSGGLMRSGWSKWAISMEGGTVGQTHMCFVARLVPKKKEDEEAKAEAKDGDGDRSDEESSSDDDFSQSEEDDDEEGGGVDSMMQAKKTKSILSKEEDSDDDDATAINFSRLSLKELKNPNPDVVELTFSLCRHDRRDKVLNLLDRGFDPRSVESSFGNTLLHVACQNGNAVIGRALLRRGGVDVDSRNRAGNTPLHFAMYYKHEELKYMLLAEGADDTVTNNEGLTPWEGLRADELDEM